MCHPKELEDVPGTIVGYVIEGLDCGCELGNEHVLRPDDHCRAGSGWGPQESWVKLMRAQGQRRRRQSLHRGRESSAVRKSSGNERGWIFSDSSKDRIMVLEDLAASVIGGQVEGRFSGKLYAERDTRRSKKLGRCKRANKPQEEKEAMHAERFRDEFIK